MTILITGAAGFIGYHLSMYLIKKKINVIGFDNINDYYDPKLKESRLENLIKFSNKENASFKFIKGDLEDKNKINDLFTETKPRVVINLAAQAGVRYSLTNPDAYINANIIGFTNLIEACKNNTVDHLIYASSSSVYGGNKALPFSEKDNVDHPVSLYAASKKMNELMAHTYSHLYNLPVTGLRFFTVYGPWGRPDMALFKFTKNILTNKNIDVYNNGDMIRDFTYIDDIVESIYRLIDKIPIASKNIKTTFDDPSTSWCPYEIFNVGNSRPEPLMRYISCLENTLGIKAKINFLPMQDGDVQKTFANTEKLENLIKFKPNTSIEYGISRFVDWYKKYYSI